MIKKREAAIISAYTGYLLGDFSTMHEYIEEILERPVFMHELGSASVAAEIKKKSKHDFTTLNVKK
jgi:hypothetical protein